MARGNRTKCFQERLEENDFVIVKVLSIGEETNVKGGLQTVNKKREKGDRIEGESEIPKATNHWPDSGKPEVLIVESRVTRGGLI